MSLVNQNFIKEVETTSDINEHLFALFALATKCETVVEMGVRRGSSSRAFIAARPDKLTSYDIELWPEAIEAFEAGQAEGINCELVLGNTHEIEIDPVDMIFIDTEHTYECLSKELALHGDKAKKFLAFHDTISCKDEIVPAIKEFMDKSGHWGLYFHHELNNGLLVLKRWDA